MQLKPTRTAAIVAVAGLALVGGGGAALESSLGSGNANGDREAIVSDAAKRLGVEPSALENALKQAALARVDAAVKAGRLTQQQADAITARIEAGNGPLLGGFGGFGRHLGGGRHLAMLEAAASYLGVTTDGLRADRQAGKSLAQIAGEKGKSVDGLEGAMLDAAKEELDSAVSEGRLTAGQEQQMLDRLKSRIGEMVQRTGFERRFGGPSSRGFRPEPPLEAPTA